MQQQPEERRKTKEEEVEKWKIRRKTGRSMGLLVTSSGGQERRNMMNNGRWKSERSGEEWDMQESIKFAQGAVQKSIWDFSQSDQKGRRGRVKLFCVFYLGCLNGEKNNDIPLIFTGCSIAQNLLRDRQATVKKKKRKKTDRSQANEFIQMESNLIIQRWKTGTIQLIHSKKGDESRARKGEERQGFVA